MSKSHKSAICIVQSVQTECFHLAQKCQIQLLDYSNILRVYMFFVFFNCLFVMYCTRSAESIVHSTSQQTFKKYCFVFFVTFQFKINIKKDTFSFRTFFLANKSISDLWHNKYWLCFILLYNIAKLTLNYDSQKFHKTLDIVFFKW